MGRTEIIDFELSEFVKEMIICNVDVNISKELKDKIKDYPVGTLLKITKRIDRGINILSIEEATEELIAKDLEIQEQDKLSIKSGKRSKIIDKLDNLYSIISFRYITTNRAAPPDEMITINKRFGKIIEELREIDG